jgi:hypothetical protein
MSERLPPRSPEVPQSGTFLWTTTVWTDGRSFVNSQRRQCGQPLCQLISLARYCATGGGAPFPRGLPAPSAAAPFSRKPASSSQEARWEEQSC